MWRCVEHGGENTIVRWCATYRILCGVASAFFVFAFAFTSISTVRVYQLKKMKLIAGTSVALNFKLNEALQKHLGLCGDCLCRNCECASSSSSSRGKNARDAREAYAERRKKKLAKA